jgi:hypothetical protein
MANQTVETLLQDIGRLIEDSLGEDADGTFMYVEAQPDVMSAIILKDLGERVVAMFPSDELTNALFNAWDLAEEGKKWGSLFYTISGQRFDARFQYPNEWNLDEDYDDRLARILAAKYEGKTIEYPQLDVEG